MFVSGSNRIPVSESELEKSILVPKLTWYVLKENVLKKIGINEHIS